MKTDEQQSAYKRLHYANLTKKPPLQLKLLQATLSKCTQNYEESQEEKLAKL